MFMSEPNPLEKGWTHIIPLRSLLCSRLHFALEGVEDLHTVGVNNTKTLLAELHTFVIRKKNAEGEALDPDEMRQVVRDNLAEHSVPEHIHFVDDLPRNATGKVVPRLLPVPDQD